MDPFGVYLSGCRWLLLPVCGCWNNYFLPLAMISDQTLLPVTVGMNPWQAQSNSATANGLI